MTTSSVGYSMLSRSMELTLRRVGSQAAVKREQEYYDAHINGVKDVDGFIGDYRLYNYAMEAYGLDDMVYAKAFMKKVLESDLTDPNSFANKLSDSRYKTFAAAFNFHSPNAGVQTPAQTDELIGLYTQSFKDNEKAASTEANYFKTAMRYVGSVDDILGKPRLKDFVLDAFGIDGKFVSRDFLKKVLTSDVNDPASFVNTQANDKYKAMAAAFSFGPDGKTTSPLQSPQSASQTADLIAKATANGKSYFEDKIGAVSNVDSMLADAKLNRFVRFVYKVGSGVSDSDLKAYLTDPAKAASTGHSALHAAFNFAPDGSSNGAAQTEAQTAGTMARFDGATAEYRHQMSLIADLGDIAEEPALTSYIGLAFGVPSSLSTENFKRMLTDEGYASSVGASGAPAMFNFRNDGSLSGSAQTSAQRDAMLEKYTLGTLEKVIDYDDTAHGPTDVYYVTSAAAQYNKAYYEKTIKTITNVDELMSDKRMVAYVKAAFSLGKHGYGSGVGDEMSDFALRQALVNPKLAGQLGVSDLNKAFNFNTDGSVSSPDGAQGDAAMNQTSVQYKARYQNEAKDFLKEITANYKKRITSSTPIANVDDLLKSNRAADTNKKNDDLPDVYHVALKAFGLTDAELPKSTVRKLLESDAYAPKGYVASFKDKRITNFARAFNIDSNGDVGPHLGPLSDASMAKLASGYKSRTLMFMADGPLKDKASKDATKAVDEFAKGMEKVKSLDDLLADKKLTGFVLTSVGLDPKDYSKETLKKIFTSDPLNDKSYLNTKADGKFKDIVADFNFDTKGNLTRAKLGAIQDKGAMDRTDDAYVQQTLETQEGQTNDGTRLALYFTRKAPQITSLYSILGDKALFQVVTTAFNLPSQLSGMEPDRQVALLEKFVDLKDLGDAKKVDKLVKRFTAMYDIKNNANASPALQILGRG
jgi:hypothetical protein